MEVDVKPSTPEKDSSGSQSQAVFQKVSEKIGKLCKENPAVCNLKVMLVAMASMSVTLLVAAIVSDTQILTTHGHTRRFERLGVAVSLVDARVGAYSVRVNTAGVDKTYKYTELVQVAERYETEHISDSAVDAYLSSDLSPVLGFRLPITDIRYGAWAGTFAMTCEIIGVCLTALGIILQLIFRTTPDSFILKPGISSRFSITRFENVKQGLPGFLLMTASVVLTLGAVVTSSFIHNMVYRLIVFSVVQAATGSSQLSAWRLTMKEESVLSKQERLRFMQFVGKYLDEPKSVSFGFSFFAILFAIGLNLLVLFVLYYNDNRIARSCAAAGGGSNGVDSSVEVQWNSLPAHCKVRPFAVSVLVFFLGLAVTAFGGNVARRRGVKMNRHPYEVAGVSQSFIDDVVISHTTDYFFSTAGIVDGAVMIFMPLLVMVAISSLDRVRFASKCLELLGVIFVMRGMAVMSTIMPTLFNVLQHPQCWDRPGTKLTDMLAEKEFCNDLMFSGHTVFAMLPAMIFAFNIVYGPYSYKPLIVGAVMLTATALTSLIVAGRLHYTSDVIVAVILTALLVIMNAPVWKLQFSFRKAQSGIGNVSAIDKVPNYLEQAAERLNGYTVAVREDTNQTTADYQSESSNPESWNSLSEAYAALGDVLMETRQSAESAEKEEDEPIAIEPHPQYEQEPLLCKV